MALASIDEEKGPSHPQDRASSMKLDETSYSNTSTAVSSPQLSRDSTIVVSPASGEADSESQSPRPTFWAKRVDSLRSTFGRRKTSDLESLAEDDDDLSDDDGDSDTDTSNLIVRKIHKQAPGYPRLGTFLDSDESFMVYRRFGYLQSRLILDRQDELANLEMDLDLMEHREAANARTAGRLTSRRYMSSEKKALLDKIEVKWNAYSQILSNAAKLAAFNRPTANEHRSVLHWMENVKPVVAAESKFLRCKEDLIILRPGREHAWLDAGVENFLKWAGWAPLRKIFQNQDTREKSNGEDGTVLYSRRRIENFVAVLITLMILALLVVPIWVLFQLSQRSTNSSRTSLESIGVLLIATLAFSACLSLFTRARRHEVLAASAAYCAVLVVFIGNLGQHFPESMSGQSSPSPSPSPSI